MINIHLRPFVLSDVPAFTAAVRASLDTLLPWMVWAHHDYQPHEAESWIRFTHWQRLKGEAEEFAIVDDNDRLLGGAGLRFARDPGQFAALGYWVRSDMQRQGIASRAVTELLPLGFSRPGSRGVEILAAENNLASRAVAEKCGGQFIGCRYGLIVLKEGPVNSAIYHFQRAEAGKGSPSSRQ
ncbi:GNAT family N-acetyltransferase [Pantoea sp. C2G6]|uniref:GNAT family N-acetyltransferase n=1 Tax=Pantoea sp. C2G6 TaxID=3243084 RepID=UPI003EDAE3F3